MNLFPFLNKNGFKILSILISVVALISIGIKWYLLRYNDAWLSYLFNDHVYYLSIVNSFKSTGKMAYEIVSPALAARNAHLGTAIWYGLVSFFSSTNLEFVQILHYSTYVWFPISVFLLYRFLKWIEPNPLIHLTLTHFVIMQSVFFYSLTNAGSEMFFYPIVFIFLTYIIQQKESGNRFVIFTLIFFLYLFRFQAIIIVASAILVNLFHRKYRFSFFMGISLVMSMILIIGTNYFLSDVSLGVGETSRIEQVSTFGVERFQLFFSTCFGYLALYKPWAAVLSVAFIGILILGFIHFNKLNFTYRFLFIVIVLSLLAVLLFGKPKDFHIYRYIYYIYPLIFLLLFKLIPQRYYLFLGLFIFVFSILELRNDIRDVYQKDIRNYYIINRYKNYIQEIDSLSNRGYLFAFPENNDHTEKRFIYAVTGKPSLIYTDFVPNDSLIYLIPTNQKFGFSDSLTHIDSVFSFYISAAYSGITIKKHPNE